MRSFTREGCCLTSRRSADPAGSSVVADHQPLPRDPSELRALVRAGAWREWTIDVCPSYLTTTVIILPEAYAADFLRYCLRNPRACPLLDVTDPGDPEPRRLAPWADIRTDLPRYRLWEYGEIVGEVDDLRASWRNDLVSFFFGCSATLEGALHQANVQFVDEGGATCRAMYDTTVDTVPAGRFRARLVVTMRPLAPSDVARAVHTTGRLPAAHGAPIHIGDPAGLGITDLRSSPYGDVANIALRPSDVPVFWACSVTADLAARHARPDFMITFIPNYFFITDIPITQLAEW